MGDRFTEDQVDDMFREAPIDNRSGDFDYNAVCTISRKKVQNFKKNQFAKFLKNSKKTQKISKKKHKIPGKTRKVSGQKNSKYQEKNSKTFRVKFQKIVKLREQNSKKNKQNCRKKNIKIARKIKNKIVKCQN